MAKTVYIVAAAIQNEAGEILMALRPQGKPFAGVWEFPGGKIEEGETPEQAVMREVKEETALVLSEEGLVPLTFVSKALEKDHVAMFFYLARNWQGTALPQEGQQHAWVPWRELMGYKPDSLDHDTHVFDVLMEWLARDAVEKGSHVQGATGT